MLSSVSFYFFLVFQFIDKGEGVLHTRSDCSSFLHNFHVFFWLCVLFTSVNIKHEACGVSVLLEVKVNVISPMTTSYFLLQSQLRPGGGWLLSTTPSSC